MNLLHHICRSLDWLLQLLQPHLRDQPHLHFPQGSVQDPALVKPNVTSPAGEGLEPAEQRGTVPRTE